MYACTFFGHRDAGKSIEPILRSTLIDLIENKQVFLFYVGNQGSFDRMVEQTLRTLQKQNCRLRYYVVLAYLPRAHQSQESDPDTLFPEGIERVPRKYAIVWRNRWMIDHADTVITYVENPYGGAAQFKNAAIKKGKTVIELADRL